MALRLGCTRTYTYARTGGGARGMGGRGLGAKRARAQGAAGFRPRQSGRAWGLVLSPRPGLQEVGHRLGGRERQHRFNWMHMDGGGGTAGTEY